MADVTFLPVRLAAGEPGSEAVMAMRGDQLVAILSRLTALHDELEGRWFVETSFGKSPDLKEPTFPDLEAFRIWAAG